MSRVVDEDEFAEVELVSEPFPFGLVQDALVVVVSASKMFSVSDCTLGCVSVHRMRAAGTLMVCALMFLAKANKDRSASRAACVASVDAVRVKYLFDLTTYVGYDGVRFIYSARPGEELRTERRNIRGSSM